MVFLVHEKDETMATIDAYKVAIRIMNDKNISDDEWMQLQNDIREFLNTDPPEEEKSLFYPLGCLEIVDIMCDGIERDRKLHVNEMNKKSINTPVKS